MLTPIKEKNGRENKSYETNSQIKKAKSSSKKIKEEIKEEKYSSKELFQSIKRKNKEKKIRLKNKSEDLRETKSLINFIENINILEEPRKLIPKKLDFDNFKGFSNKIFTKNSEFNESLKSISSKTNSTINCEKNEKIDKNFQKKLINNEETNKDVNSFMNNLSDALNQNLLKNSIINNDQINLNNKKEINKSIDNFSDKKDNNKNNINNLVTRINKGCFFYFIINNILY